MPNESSIPTGFTMPDTAPGNFEIKPAFLNLIERNQFGGGASEDPNKHIQIFVDYCSTIKQTGVSQSDIRTMLFPFSLRDNARQWITDLDRAAHGITDWNSMALVFYQKYYPPEKTNRLRSQITSFRQTDDEALFEAWERYKKLIRECPHHGLNNWLIIMQFYNGLREENRAILDSAANGRFANNTDEDKAWGLIEEMAVHNQQYCRQKASSSKIHDTDSISVLTSHIAALTQQLGKLQGPSLSVNALGGQTDVTCGACGMLGHTSSECRTNTYEVNSFQSGNFNSNVYTENSRNHPNFSWRSNNVLNPPVQQFQQPQQSQQVTYQKQYTPPGFQRSNFQQPPPPNQSNLESMMQQMLNLQATQSAQITELMAHRKIVDTQIAQISASSSTRQQGSLPAQGKQLLEDIREHPQ